MKMSRCMIVALCAVSQLVMVTKQTNAGFIVQLESEADLGSGSEVLYTTYPDLAAILAVQPSSSTFSSANIIGSYSTTGLAYDGAKGGADVAVPEPSSIVLFGIGGIALVGFARRRKQQAA